MYCPVVHLGYPGSDFVFQVTPNPNTPVGYSIRSTLVDIIDVFEVNQKECARLSLEYPKWNLPRTFKLKSGVPITTEPVPGKDWQLESTIIEVQILYDTT